MKTVVIGGNGQLGADVVAVFRADGHDTASLTHDDLEVADVGSVTEALGLLKPDVVINTSAMHNVELCEEHPADAFRINAIGAGNLARGCAGIGAMLVHVSTDYVFGGEKRTPYVESDLPRPVNAYGISKLAGEHFAFALHDRVAIVRTSAIYGENPCRAKKGDNFVKLMLRLGRERGRVKVVTDEAVSPTYTVDIASQILEIVKAAAVGIFHATSQGQCSWNEFARAIFEEAGAAVIVDDATSGDFPSKVRRPAYSVLDNRALRDLGIDMMPPWRDALRRYVRTLEPAAGR